MPIDIEHQSIDVHDESVVKRLLNQIEILREKTNVHLSDAAITVIDTAAQQTATALMDAAMQRLTSLLQQSTQQSPQSLFPIVMRRFDEKSTLTQIIEWYAQKTTFQKVVMGTTAIVGSALVGALFQLSALFTLISISVFLAAETILTEHHRLFVQQQHQLSQDIGRMEQAYLASLTPLNEATEQVHQISVRLLEKNIQSAELLRSFDAHTNALKQQTQSFLNAFHALNEAYQTLLSEHRIVVTQLQHLHGELEQANAVTASQSNTIDTITLQLETTQQALEASNAGLKAIQDEFFLVLASFKALEVQFKEEACRLQTTTAGSLSAHQQANAPDDLDAFIKMHQAMCDEAQKACQETQLFLDNQQRPREQTSYKGWF